MDNSKILVLFDVDGTLTKPRQVISDKNDEFFKDLQKKVTVGLVGGSDLPKIAEQMNCSEEEVVKKFTYVFSENGLVAYKEGKLINKGSIQKHIGEENLQKFINYALRKLSEIDIPVKRGTFIEFRSGMINVCPVGRSCSQAERDQFYEYDKIHKIRETLVNDFKEKFSSIGLNFVIGGQISFDVFPDGWDKRYCLQFVKDSYDVIHFFGDKTSPGGNDYAIFNDPSTIGHTVTSPDDTVEQCTKILL